MTVPIAALLASFATGVALLQSSARLPPACGALLVAGAGVTAAALLAVARAAPPGRKLTLGGAALARLAAIAAVAGIGVTGFSYAAWRADVRLADELPPAWEERDVRVTGVIDDLPQVGPGGVRFALAVERTDTPGAIVPRRISLAWHAQQASDQRQPRDPPSTTAPLVHAGERWALTVRMKRPHGNVNPHGFDLEAWLLERNLRATGQVRDSPANLRIAEFAGRAGDHVQRARERIRLRIAHALPDAPYAGVLTALAIGDQRAVPEAQWIVFNRTGVTHLVSISGLHVTVFATLAGGVALACARRSSVLTSRIPALKLAALAGVMCAFAYVLLAGAEVPAVRTLLMLVVAAVGLWLARPGTAVVVWLWSLVIVLLWDPWATLAPGFWLSFGAVGLLLYTGCGRIGTCERAFGCARLLQSMREAARGQWVVTVGLAPGAVALFQQVSVVSALANAVAIPAVTLGVVPLALLAIVVPIDALWRVAHAVLALVMRYLEWVSTLPSAAWTTHAPRGWTIAVSIAGVLWLLAPRGVPGRLLGAVWMVPMALLLPPPVANGGLRITVLDVGQGLAVVVSTAQHVLVYDAGPRFNEAADAGARIVVPFLRASGVAHLDALVVSHADTDHSGGALSVMRAMRVKRLISSLPGDHPIVGQAGSTQPIRCLAGSQWQWDDVTFSVLHPLAGDYGDPLRKSNDLSCVLRIQVADSAFLLTGDIEARSELELLQRSSSALRSDVLVVPHHGSRTSSTPQFVAAATPSVAIIAAGYRNRFGHPRSDVLARYARADTTALRTDLQGAITVTVEPGATIVPQAERERRRRYWYDVPSR